AIPPSVSAKMWCVDGVFLPVRRTIIPILLLTISCFTAILLILRAEEGDFLSDLLRERVQNDRVRPHVTNKNKEAIDES
ncbi:hypothetical protein M1N19_03415, partial [Dehalococcoidia bacterium]|nr:hypothetical protein [Dehalococcoidia bacterium]